MKQIVLYHRADWDGIFCREIARKFLPDATLIGWDYGDPTPAKAEIDGTEQLYMLDEKAIRFMKPTVPEVLPLVRAYYAKPGNNVGGSFHIVLEDMNIFDHNVEWCLNYAREIGDVDGVVIGELLLKMSRTQRLRLAYADKD